MRTIPIFGSGVVGKSPVVTAQRRVNCYYEIREDGDKQKIVVYGTPGTTLFVDLGAGPVRGIYSLTSKLLLYVVTSNTLWEIDTTGLATNRGTVTKGINIVSMVDNGTQLLILDGTKGWIFNTTTNVLTQIADANFPQTASTGVFDSGFFLVNDPSSNGRFRSSASYDGTTWPAANFGTAESNPDPLIALHALGNVVHVFGSLSLEFHQSVGTVGFPYAPLKASTQNYGLAAKWSRAPLFESIAFLSQNKQGTVQVMRLNGLSLLRISTTDIENIINSFSVVSDATAFGYLLDGHAMYQINFPTANRSFLYDGLSNMWSEMQTGVGLTGRHIANVGDGFNGKFYVGDNTLGRVYLVDPTSFTDNGVTIPRIVQTRHIFQDFNVLGIDEFFVDVETGVGLQLGQGNVPRFILQVSKDGGRTFGIERWVSIGAAGQYKDHRAIWRRFGSGRDFVFRIIMTDPVKFTVVGGGVVPRIGTDNEQYNNRVATR